MTPISVIIPTYNRAALVPLAINSVLAQTHAAAEIIVVDDGSPDNTQEVLAGYGKRITVIRQSNSGVSIARNAGIAAAKSEWVSFLDDDDLYSPERLAIAAESIRRFPKTKIHASNMGIFINDQPAVDLFALRGLKATEHMPLPTPLIWALKGCYYVQSLVVHRPTIDDIGRFRNMLFEDLDLVARLSRCTPWVVDVRHSVRLMRRDAGLPNLSTEWRAKPIERCEALVRIHRDALACGLLNEHETRFTRTGLATYLFELGASYYANGERANARRNLVEAANTFPAFHSRLKARAAAVGGRPVLSLLQVISRKRKGVVR